MTGTEIPEEAWPGILDWLAGCARRMEGLALLTDAGSGGMRWEAGSDGNVSETTDSSGYGGGAIAVGPWGGDLAENGRHMAFWDPARALVLARGLRANLELYRYVDRQPLTDAARTAILANLRAGLGVWIDALSDQPGSPFPNQMARPLAPVTLPDWMTTA